jgi:GMP synthase-like glutamine amidotransferase
MRVLAIENYRGTPLGVVGDVLREAGVTVDLRQAHLGDPVGASPGDYSGLVVLGGEQSALDDAEHPFLPEVAALTRAFGEADKAVLGICLGAQLVARGHGAENILGRPVEFGWREVKPTEAGRADPLLAAIDGGAPLFHWHTDTFTLPEGAAHLATSAMTPHQAFRIGRAVYGIQFHFEADRRVVEQWSRDFAAVIAGYAPDWPERHPRDAARFGPKADAAGRAIARAWTALLR